LLALRYIVGPTLTQPKNVARDSSYAIKVCPNLVDRPSIDEVNPSCRGSVDIPLGPLRGALKSGQHFQETLDSNQNSSIPTDQYQFEQHKIQCSSTMQKKVA
jgi:hypothetical protein